MGSIAVNTHAKSPCMCGFRQNIRSSFCGGVEAHAVSYMSAHLFDPISICYLVCQMTKNGRFSPTYLQ